MIDISAGVTITSFRADFGVGAGVINVNNLNNMSITEYLNNSNTVTAVGGTGSYGIGGKITNMTGFTSDESQATTFNVTLLQFTFGLSGPSGSISSSDFSVGSWGLQTPMTRDDSMNTAFIFRNYPKFEEYLKNQMIHGDSIKLGFKNEKDVNYPKGDL